MLNKLNSVGAVATWFGKQAMAVVLLCLLILMGASSPLLGQDQGENFDLLGRLIDKESRKPLLGASVGLSGSDWSSITDQNGIFEIPGAFVGWKADRKGGFSVTANHLGYKTLIWEGDISRSDEILVLEISPQVETLRLLSDLKKSFNNRRIGSGTDVVAYDRGDLVTAREATALRFLENHLRIPLRDEPLVFVDEVSVMSGLDYLDGLDPIDLELMEIFQSGRHVRIYTTDFLERAAKSGFQPRPLLF